MLTRWLPATEDTLPPNASHQVCFWNIATAILCSRMSRARASEGHEMPQWNDCIG
jgi:hypothetical protein